MRFLIALQSIALFAGCESAGTWKEVLRCRKILHVDNSSISASEDKLARELLSSPEFVRFGYSIVQNTFTKAARIHGLHLRVARKPFTTRYTISLVDPATSRMLIAAEASSLGGEIEPKLAHIVMKWILEANKDVTTPLPPAPPVEPPAPTKTRSGPVGI